MKKLFRLKSLCLLFLIIISCQKEEIINSDNGLFEKKNQFSRPINNDKPDIHTQIVLGEKLKNPYSVINMQNAFNYYNSHVHESKFGDRVVTKTHLYIKINPKNLKDLETINKLDDSDNLDAPILQDYPMDYKILTEGDYYVYPKNETDLYYPTYTVIPFDYKLPSNLSYEVLEELYQPTTDEFDVETVSLFYADWDEDLEADDIDVTEETLPDYLNNNHNQYLLNPEFYRRSKFTPDGWINVENTDSNIYEPLMQAKISYGRSLWWHYTYTDDTGYFTAAHSYRGKVRIRAKWRGYTASIRKTWNEILGISVSDHLFTVTRNNNGVTKNIEYGEPNEGIFGFDLAGGHLWYKGTVHNGLRKYIDYCNLNGISNTIDHALVWSFANGNASSTPMLHKYPNLAGMASLANVGQADFWNVSVNYVFGTLISLLPPWILPDQIHASLKPKEYEDGRSNTVRIHQTIFHESGHYSHASLAGQDYWAHVFASEFSNNILTGDPYSDGSDPSFQAADRISVAEGWATITELKVSKFYYNKLINVGVTVSNIDTYIEDFNQFETPMSFQRTRVNSWFMQGIMWDLLDNQNDLNSNFNSTRRYDDNIFRMRLIDRVFIGNLTNEYDLSSLFNNLDYNVINYTELQNKLLILYPTETSSINNLFETYYYGIP